MPASFATLRTMAPENLLACSFSPAATWNLHTTQPKQRQRGTRTWPHPRAAWPSPGPRHQGVSLLVHLLTWPFRLYIPLDGKNLRPRSIFHETYCKPPPSSTRDREGPEALPGILLEAFFITMVASGVMCE
jgi:hypothetical protein